MVPVIKTLMPRRAARPTEPGETRFWCSCDPGRKNPFSSARELVAHVMQARASHEGACR